MPALQDAPDPARRIGALPAETPGRLSFGAMRPRPAGRAAFARRRVGGAAGATSGLRSRYPRTSSPCSASGVARSIQAAGAGAADRAASSAKAW